MIYNGFPDYGPVVEGDIDPEQPIPTPPGIPVPETVRIFIGIFFIIIIYFFIFFKIFKWNDNLN